MWHYSPSPPDASKSTVNYFIDQTRTIYNVTQTSRSLGQKGSPLITSSLRILGFDHKEKGYYWCSVHVGGYRESFLRTKELLSVCCPYKARHLSGASFCLGVPEQVLRRIGLWSYICLLYFPVGSEQTTATNPSIVLFISSCYIPDEVPSCQEPVHLYNNLTLRCAATDASIDIISAQDNVGCSSKPTEEPAGHTIIETTTINQKQSITAAGVPTKTVHVKQEGNVSTTTGRQSENEHAMGYLSSTLCAPHYTHAHIGKVIGVTLGATTLTLLLVTGLLVAVLMKQKFQAHSNISTHFNGGRFYNIMVKDSKQGVAVATAAVICEPNIAYESLDLGSNTTSQLTSDYAAALDYDYVN